MVQQLLAAGAEVFAIGREPSALKQLEAQGCHVLRLDIADSAALEVALSTFPALHGLVNCAGIANLEAADSVTAESFDQVMAVNARAAALVAGRVAKSMIAAGIAGSIVNVSSQASLVALDDHLSY